MLTAALRASEVEAAAAGITFTLKLHSHPPAITPTPILTFTSRSHFSQLTLYLASLPAIVSPPPTTCCSLLCSLCLPALSEHHSPFQSLPARGRHSSHYAEGATIRHGVWWRIGTAGYTRTTLL